MKKWIFQVVVAIFALMPLPSAIVSAQDGAGLGINESAAPTLAAVGDNITYTYAITNTDNVTISGLTLQDSWLGTIGLGGQTSLAAGENITATATYTVVEADLPGPLVSTATINGTDPSGNAVTASATATVQLTYTASLQLAKVASQTSATVGDNVTYTYTITNNGPVTISNIGLNDVPLGSIDLGGQTSLNAGGTITATAIYTIVKADLPGPLVNTATVAGTDPQGQTITSSATASVSLRAGDDEDDNNGDVDHHKGNHGNKHHGDDDEGHSDNMTKCQILKLRGVPGKGIDKAPGLQKPFNPKSQAAEHAGNKGIVTQQQQLTIRQSTQNHDDIQGQIKIKQKVKNGK